MPRVTPSARGTKGGKVGGPIRARNRRNGWHDPEPSAAVRKLLDRMRVAEEGERHLAGLCRRNYERGGADVERQDWLVHAHAANLLRDIIREAERG